MRKPDWLRMNITGKQQAVAIKSLINDYNLNTVCESARCPNKSECYNSGTATFLVLGNICTRKCTFCAVNKDSDLIQPPDIQEPTKISEFANRLNLDYLVVTMVTRDDLPDGGADHIVRIIETVRLTCKNELWIEVLVSDFGGDYKQISKILDAQPDVFNHNMETVPRLYDKVRPGANYQRSLKILSLVKDYSPTTISKSGFMVGLGESPEEINVLMDNLMEAKVDLLTIGQYLAPSVNHYAVKEYIHPNVFAQYRAAALSKGFKDCVSGPFVRSSYKAHFAKDLK